MGSETPHWVVKVSPGVAITTRSGLLFPALRAHGWTPGLAAHCCALWDASVLPGFMEYGLPAHRLPLRGCEDARV